jgi:hypothetical protein
MLGGRSGFLLGNGRIIRYSTRVFRSDGGVKSGIQEESNLIRMSESRDFVLLQFNEMSRRGTVHHKRPPKNQGQEGIF